MEPSTPHLLPPSPDGAHQSPLFGPARGIGCKYSHSLPASGSCRPPIQALNVLVSPLTASSTARKSLWEETTASCCPSSSHLTVNTDTHVHTDTQSHRHTVTHRHTHTHTHTHTYHGQQSSHLAASTKKQSHRHTGDRVMPGGLTEKPGNQVWSQCLSGDNVEKVIHD